MKPNGQDNRITSEECKSLSPRLTEYVDGRLDPDLTWRIKNHVAICVLCSDSVNAISDVARILGGASRLEVSATFASNLEARVAALPRKTGFAALINRQQGFWFGHVGFSLRSAPLAAAAAALLVFVCLLVSTPFGVQHIQPTVRVGTGNEVNVDDPAVIQPLIGLHREQVASDPLDDTSAQVLTASVDSLPVDQSKNHRLSDADAAVLLDEEM